MQKARSVRLSTKLNIELILGVWRDVFRHFPQDVSHEAGEPHGNRHEPVHACRVPVHFSEGEHFSKKLRTRGIANMIGQLQWTGHMPLRKAAKGRNVAGRV